MPFRSEAQRRKFYADPRLRKYIKEWETGKKLPKRLHPKKDTPRKKALRRRMGSR